MDFSHEPVLLKECIEGLNIHSDGVYVDCTLGGAGHSTEILKRLGSQGMLIGIDQDKEALEVAKVRLSKVNSKGNFVAIHDNFENIRQIIKAQKIKSVDGILIDLGVSSYQLDNDERGFKYQEDASLDMRMNQSSDFTAKELINTWSKDDIVRVIRGYGEERWAVRIAEFICNARANTEIQTTLQLVDIIKAAIPASARREGPHPAKRTFQAIRIAVNRELEVLEEVLPKMLESLNKGGRLCVITFHSLEDRIVKQFINNSLGRCKCPSDFPKCVCNAVKELQVIRPRIITPSQEELQSNHRARSAKLRVSEKV